jgi:hypothetical protein
MLPEVLKQVLDELKKLPPHEQSNKHIRDLRNVLKRIERASPDDVPRGIYSLNPYPKGSGQAQGFSGESSSGHGRGQADSLDPYPGGGPHSGAKRTQSLNPYPSDREDPTGGPSEESLNPYPGDREP